MQLPLHQNNHGSDDYERIIDKQDLNMCKLCVKCVKVRFKPGCCHIKF